MKKNFNKPWDAENSFYHLSDVTRVAKLVYQYEIYKMIKNIPGDVVEFGVFKGSSLIKFLTFREILENNSSRKFYAFDAFGKFPRSKTKKFDEEFIKKFEKDAGHGIKIKKLQSILQKKGFKNFELIKGDINLTALDFLKKNKSIKISLLHLDLDTYFVTRKILEKFFNNVVKKGIILIDDYNVSEGVTRAIDEFLKGKKDIQLRKLSYYKQPSYIIKN